MKWKIQGRLSVNEQSGFNKFKFSKGGGHEPSPDPLQRKHLLISYHYVCIYIYIFRFISCLPGTVCEFSKYSSYISDKYHITI